MLCVEDDEGATKVLSSLFVHALVYSTKTLQHMTDAISSFEVHQLLRTKQCRQLPCQSDIVLDLKIARMSLRGSITMQCGLSAGEQN